MQAFEFQTTVQDGIIHIPERFKGKITRDVKVIVLNDEKDVQLNAETLEAIEDVNIVD
jgi:hypothetical protein